MNILECTIKMKREARAHYEKLAEIATDNDLKRLFSLMASAEGEHIDSLVAVKKSMNPLKVPGGDRLKGNVCVYSPHVDLRHFAEVLRHDPDVYRHIVAEEEETIEYFDQLVSQADSEDMKRICRLLAEKEREHLTKLENIYLFVEEPRTYLEWGEFSNLKSL